MTTKLKFRAECQPDVDELLELIPPACIVSMQKTHNQFSEPTICLEVNDLTIDDVRNRMREVVDGHVMVQTLSYEESYTGERNWNL